MAESIVSPCALHSEVLRGGQMWSRVVRRGQLLRLTDTEGGATVAALLYNSRQPLERYNMADTLKAQHTAFITTGHVLYSDMGRILMSVVDDSSGWHDTFTGCMGRQLSEAKFGAGTYQDLRNGFHRNTRDNFLVELGKHGLGKRDIVPNLNFFVKVTADSSGALHWATQPKPGSHVTLRAEMDVLVVLSNTPHPLAPGAEYQSKPLELTLMHGAPVGPEDNCRTHCPENGRGFVLTEDYCRTLEGAVS
jgi:urea carboxylase-associated protein 2